jgi:hypothetical protein
MRELVLNYQGFRGKFHILAIRCHNDREVCTVAKQIQNRIGYHWGHVTSIDQSQTFREASVDFTEISSHFEAAEGITFPTTRKPRRGIDGTWYSLRIGDAATGKIVSWWSDTEPELQSLYDLRDQVVVTVMKLLRSSAQK